MAFQVDGAAPLAAGTVIKSMRAEYVVNKVLGQGGCGCVYLVQNRENGEMFAMKTEAAVIQAELERLKIESNVMELIRTHWQPHLLYAVDKGIEQEKKFLVIPLVGASIDKIREKKMGGRPFSRSTVVQILIQMMTAIRNLHELGILHRDIKPANFAIGYHDPQNIYLLDYGLARYFRSNKGFLQQPRPQKNFAGTKDYCSRGSMGSREYCRADDVESWFYVLFELFGKRDDMPWFGEEIEKLDDDERAKMGEQNCALKKKFWARDYLCYKWREGLPELIWPIFWHIRKLTYYEIPDYDYIIQLMHEMDSVEKFCKLREPLDWMRKKTKKGGRSKSVSRTSDDNTTGGGTTQMGTTQTMGENKTQD